MLSLCWNLCLVDFFQRFVAFMFYLFPCAELSNVALEVAVLRAGLRPYMTCCDPFQTKLFLDSVKLFGNKGDSSGSDMWHWVWWLHVPRNPSVAGLAEGCRKAPREAAWTLRSMVGGQHCKDFETLDFLNCGNWKLTARLFKGTSAYTWTRKMISFGQCVKQLWIVRFEFYFR